MRTILLGNLREESKISSQIIGKTPPEHKTIALGLEQKGIPISWDFGRYPHERWLCPAISACTCRPTTSCSPPEGFGKDNESGGKEVNRLPLPHQRDVLLALSSLTPSHVTSELFSFRSKFNAYQNEPSLSFRVFGFECFNCARSHSHSHRLTVMRWLIVS